MAPQNKSDLLAEFERTGAIVLKGVLSSTDVAALRDEIQAGFVPLDRRANGAFVRSLSAAMVMRLPGVMRTILSPRIVAALKTILEAHYAIVPDFHVQRNMYDFTDTSRSATHLFGLIGSGWHHDAGHEGAKLYLFDRRYRMVKCGLYLQDNTLELGGGIETAPMGHKLPLRTAANRLNYVAMRLWQNYRILTGRRTLDLNAGDFVAFDAHLPHRGCLPHGLLDQLSAAEKAAGCVRLPPERSKLVIYFNASRQALAQTYMRHSLSRGIAEWEGLDAGAGNEIFFSDFPGLRYPEDYPPYFVARLQAEGLTMTQLDGEELQTAVQTRNAALGHAAVRNYAAPGAVSSPG